jgi:hypothetical protein
MEALEAYRILRDAGTEEPDDPIEAKLPNFAEGAIEEIRKLILKLGGLVYDSKIQVTRDENESLQLEVRGDVLEDVYGNILDDEGVNALRTLITEKFLKHVGTRKWNDMQVYKLSQRGSR